MKKLLLITGAISLITIFLALPNSYSQSSLPYPNVGEKNDPPACQQVAANQIFNMRQAWHKNLDEIRDQEKPSSAKVDDAFESMRTYRCWLDYLCETVAYSTVAIPDEAAINNNTIKQIPGCVPVESVEIPEVEIEYIPECRVVDERAVRLAEQADNLARCQKLVRQEFTTASTTSTAFITVERTLKRDSSEQKNNALQNKMAEVLNKMHAMETHMTLLKEQFFSFDSLFACVAEKCD